MDIDHKVDNNEVILIGGGGHALSLAEFSPLKIRGYIALEQNENFNSPWLGSEESLPDILNLGIPFHMAYIYSGLPLMEHRRQMIQFYEEAGARFTTLISPYAIVTRESSVGEGCAIMSGAIINRASLGRHVVVNSGGIVEHDCKIGDNTFIGPGAILGGFTSVGNNCFIGLGARIGNNITIGDNITVAMGAIVNRNLTEPGIYHGSPLRHFKA